MVIAHAFVALLAGFAATLAIGAALMFLIARLVPAWSQSEGGPQRTLSAGRVFVNLGSSFLSAAAGGYITALIAASKSLGASNPLVLVLALALVVLLISALSAMQSRGRQPAWYLLATVTIAPLGVFVGGLLRLRVLGVL